MEASLSESFEGLWRLPEEEFYGRLMLLRPAFISLEASGEVVWLAPESNYSSRGLRRPSNYSEREASTDWSGILRIKGIFDI